MVAYGGVGYSLGSRDASFVILRGYVNQAEEVNSNTERAFLSPKGVKLLEDLSTANAGALSIGSGSLSDSLVPERIAFDCTISNDADIILMPYNMELDPGIYCAESICPLLPKDKIRLKFYIRPDSFRLDTGITLKFVAISTNKKRINASKYDTAFDFYRNTDIRDVPSIELKLMFKETGVFLEWVDFNQLKKIDAKPTPDRAILNQYVEFLPYRSSSAPQFGILFTSMRTIMKAGFSNHTNLVFTPSYEHEKDAPAPGYEPTSITSFGPVPGYGLNIARTSACEYLFNNTEPDEERGFGAVINALAIGASFASAGYGLYKSLMEYINKKDQINLTFTIRNLTKNVMIINDIKSYMTLRNTEKPIINPGSTVVYPYYRGSELTYNETFALLIHGISNKEASNFLNFTVVDAGDNKSLRVSSILVNEVGHLPTHGHAYGFNDLLEEKFSSTTNQYARIRCSKEYNKSGYYTVVMNTQTYRSHGNISILIM